MPGMVVFQLATVLGASHDWSVWLFIWAYVETGVAASWAIKMKCPTVGE